MRLLQRTRQRIKNSLQPHGWREAGEGYDAALDGPDPQWGRHVIECATCGERRRVGLSLDEMQREKGCWRPGSLPYRIGDLVVVPGDYGELLDTVQGMLRGGRVLTRNAGGRTSTFRLEEIRPY